jgi:hypothetical protein
MFLEYWMILVLFVFLYFALTSVYFSGYKNGFGEGGAYGYLRALQEVQRKVYVEEQKNIEK